MVSTLRSETNKARAESDKRILALERRVAELEVLNEALEKDVHQLRMVATRASSQSLELKRILRT